MLDPQIHKVNFNIKDSLFTRYSPLELESRLKKYVRELNKVFRYTNRIFLLGKITNTWFLTRPPFGEFTNKLNYDYWIDIVSNITISGAGYATLDKDGSSVCFGCQWRDIYDVDALIEDTNSGSSYDDFWQRQFRTLPHEFLHSAGFISDVYMNATVEDITGVQPFVSVDSWNEKDPFWSRHKDWITDPMLRGLELSLLNTRLLEGNYRNDGKYLPPLPSLQNIKWKILTKDGAPVTNATIYAWRALKSNNRADVTQCVDTTTNTNGEFIWDFAKQEEHWTNLTTDIGRLFWIIYKGKNYKFFTNLFEFMEQSVILNKKEFNLTLVLDESLPYLVPMMSDLEDEKVKFENFKKEKDMITMPITPPTVPTPPLPGELTIPIIVPPQIVKPPVLPPAPPILPEPNYTKDSLLKVRAELGNIEKTLNSVYDKLDEIQDVCILLSKNLKT